MVGASATDTLTRVTSWTRLGIVFFARANMTPAEISVTPAAQDSSRRSGVKAEKENLSSVNVSVRFGAVRYGKVGSAYSASRLGH